MLAYWAPWLLRLEGVGLIGLGAYLGVRSSGHDISSPGLLIALAVITAAGGVLLAVASRAIASGSQRFQAPVIFVQISAGLSGAMMVKGGIAWVGLPLILLAAATLIGVVSIRNQDHASG